MWEYDAEKLGGLKKPGQLQNCHNQFCSADSKPGTDWAACQPGTCQLGRLVHRPGRPPRQMLKEEVERRRRPVDPKLRKKGSTLINYLQGTPISIFSSARLSSGNTHRELPFLSELLRNADEKLFTKMRSSNHSIHQLLPPAKHYPWNCAQTIVCLLSHNVITTCTNPHLFCEICFWTLIEIFCFYTMFITFVRWRLLELKGLLTYLLTYLFPSFATVHRAGLPN